MRATKLFTNITILMCSGILVASYFIPVEASWAPVDAWQGYMAGGKFLEGSDVASFEMAPYAVGLLVLIVLALFRWTKVALILLTTFMGLWIFVGAWYVYRLFTLPEIRFPLVWPILMLSIVIPSVIFRIVIARKSNQKKFVWFYLMILAMASFLQQSCSIAFALLEDKMLLNIGFVSGIAAAAVLIVSLFVRGQIQIELERNLNCEN